MIVSVLDWLQLTGMIIVLFLVSILQKLILGFYAFFPFPGLLDFIYTRSKQLQGWFSVHLGMTQGQDVRRKTARELVEEDGFGFEDHHVTTPDGFVLVLHRVINKEQGGGKQGNGRPGAGAKPADNDGKPKKLPVLIVHGLMQDSEALLCGGREHSIALYLAQLGYDVFVGNNRGNRYSHKHLKFKPHQEQYWDFSIDELARYDLPSMVDHVLAVTGNEQLQYIGFSQGSAQAFAGFSSNHVLQSKVALFIALSPAARANGLSKSMLTSLVQANLKFINVLFGRKRMLSSTILWQRIMSLELFIRSVDIAMYYLFAWGSVSVSAERKRRLYPHIYSYSSVKCVIHWFQMIRGGRLAMYEDASQDQYVPVCYDISRINIPTAVFFGGKDRIIESKSLSTTLPNCILAYEEDQFEHLDTMWGDIATGNIFQLVRSLLEGDIEHAQARAKRSNKALSDEDDTVVMVHKKSL